MSDSGVQEPVPDETPHKQVAASNEFMRQEVIEGLGRVPKELPCKYFYDERGSELFEQICTLEAYYPTRTELAIMDQHAADMAAAVGPQAMLVEYGSGSSRKTELLLAALEDPVAVVLIDISRDALRASAKRLGVLFPTVEILPLEADYSERVPLPTPTRAPRRSVIYFPGSTLGNFDHGPAQDFLQRMASVAGKGGGLLLGIDLVKDPAVLELAYDDPDGVTAEFNLNILRHINRSLGSNFDLDRFRHVAVWNESELRIEMYLESLGEQTVTVGGHSYQLADGERIATEHSNKFTTLEMKALAARAGWRQEQVWADPRQWFSVQYMSVV